MTREMDHQKLEELVNSGFYGPKTRDILNSPDTKDKMVFKTAADYVNARALQFSQNSYTGNLIEARHDPIALTLKTPSGRHTEVTNSTPLPKGFNVNELYQQSQQTQIAFKVEGAARLLAQGKIKEAKDSTLEAEKLVKGYGSLHKRAKTAMGIATTSLVLAACAQPVETYVPQTQVVETQAPVQSEFPLTSEKAQEIIDTEWGVGTVVYDGPKEFTVDSLIVDVVNTYSEVNTDQEIVNPQIIRTGHIANMSTSDGETALLPLLIDYDLQTGRNRVFALAQDASSPSEFFLVTHFNGKVVRTELKLIAQMVDGENVSLRIVNTVTGNVTQLALTPELGESPTDVPTAVPADSGWIDQLVGIITGAENAYAAEEELLEATSTPALTATSQPATSELEATVEPSDTPEPTEVPLRVIEFPGSSLDLEMAGHTVKFRIGTLEDSNIRTTWNVWGVDSIIVNRDLVDAPAVLSKAWSAWLGLLSNDGREWDSNKESFDSFFTDYLANHTDSSIGLPGAGSSFTLKDLQSIDVLYVHNGDDRLVTNEFGGQVAFKYDQNVNKLIIFTTSRPDNESLVLNFTDPQVISLLHKDTGMRQSIAHGMTTFPHALLEIDIMHTTEEHQGILDYVAYPRNSVPHTTKLSTSFWELIMIP